MSKEENLDFRIRDMEYNGKSVPQKYIDIVNGYIGDVINTKYVELKAENERLKEEFTKYKSQVVYSCDYCKNSCYNENQNLQQQLKEKDQEIERLTNGIVDNDGNKVYLGDFVEVDYDSGEFRCKTICKVSLFENKIIFKVVKGLQPIDGYYDFDEPYIEFVKIDLWEQLKAENERLKEYLLFSKTFDNKKLMEEGLKEAAEVIEFKNQQLKEKDNEIERLKAEVKGRTELCKLRYEQIKTNSKQVCEKIRQKLVNIENDGECKINIGINTLIDFDVICEILDQIEKGQL